MLIRLSTAIILCCLIFASCKENEQAKYEGVWEGTYSGDEVGTWKMHIDEDGTSQGVVSPANPNYRSFKFTGSVNGDGELSMSAAVFGSIAAYDAFLTESDLSGSWNFEEGTIVGAWSGAKKERENRFPYQMLLNP